MLIEQLVEELVVALGDAFVELRSAHPAAVTADNMDFTSASLASRAEPAALRHTFLAGQPILMSMICAPRSTLYRAEAAICRGS